METLKDKAEFYANFLETKTRANGQKFICQTDNAPKEFTEMIRNVHEAIGGRLPCDQVYDVISEVLDLLSDANDQDHAETLINEIEADIYTSDLIAWFSAHNGNAEYLTRAIQECGSQTGDQALISAQYLFKQDIAAVVFSFINAEVEQAK